MLVLSRRSRESVVLGGGGGLDRVLRVTVLRIDSNQVRLGFEVDADIPVNRSEIWERMASEKALSGPKADQELSRKDDQG